MCQVFVCGLVLERAEKSFLGIQSGGQFEVEGFAEAMIEAGIEVTGEIKFDIPIQLFDRTLRIGSFEFGAGIEVDPVLQFGLDAQGTLALRADLTSPGAVARGGVLWTADDGLQIAAEVNAPVVDFDYAGEAQITPSVGLVARVEPLIQAVVAKTSIQIDVGAKVQTPVTITSPAGSGTRWNADLQVCPILTVTAVVLNNRLDPLSLTDDNGCTDPQPIGQGDGGPPPEPVGDPTIPAPVQGALPVALVGEPYRTDLIADTAGTAGPVLWEALDVPPGLELFPDGRLEGIPDATGAFTVQARLVPLTGIDRLPEGNGDIIVERPLQVGSPLGEVSSQVMNSWQEPFEISSGYSNELRALQSGAVVTLEDAGSEATISLYSPDGNVAWSAVVDGNIRLLDRADGIYYTLPIDGTSCEVSNGPNPDPVLGQLGQLVSLDPSDGSKLWTSAPYCNVPRNEGSRTGDLYDSRIVFDPATGAQLRGFSNRSIRTVVYEQTAFFTGYVPPSQVVSVRSELDAIFTRSFGDDGIIVQRSSLATGAVNWEIQLEALTGFFEVLYNADSSELLVLGRRAGQRRLVRVDAVTGSVIDDIPVEVPDDTEDFFLTANNQIAFLDSFENNGGRDPVASGSLMLLDPIDGTITAGFVPTAAWDQGNQKRSSVLLESGQMMVATSNGADPLRQIVASTVTLGAATDGGRGGATISSSEAVGLLISSGVEPGEATRLASELGPLILRYEIPAGRTYYRYRYPTFQGQPSFRSFHRATSGGFALYVNFGGGGCDCYFDSAPNAVRSIRQATSDTVILTGHEGLGGPVEVVSGETDISSEERLFNYHTSLPRLTTRLQARTAGGPEGVPETLSTQTARDLAYFCLEQDAAIPRTEGTRCDDDVAILSHGAELGEATMLRYAAIANNPPLMRNNYQNSGDYAALLASEPEPASSIPDRTWYNDFFPCAYSTGRRSAATPNIECDEFPNYQTLNNLQRSGEGPASQGDVYIGAIRGTDNSTEGALFSSFFRADQSARSCGLPSAYDPAVVQSVSGTPDPASAFLVVPRPDTTGEGDTDRIVWLCQNP